MSHHHQGKMNQKELQALDLMLEDLQTSHPEIRTVAKKLDCENELEALKVEILDYLYSIKSHYNP
jgi:hypothetical protein